MKILHITYSDQGGPATSIQRLHDALIKKNIESKIFYFSKYINQNNIVKMKWKTNVLIKKFILKFFVKVLDKETASINFFRTLDINKVINNENPDIVHIHWIGNEIISIKDISKITRPLIWTLHDMWAFSGIKHFKENINRFENFLDRMMLAYKEKLFKNITFIAPSEWIKKRFNLTKLKKNNFVHILPSIIDLSSWRLNKNKNKNRKKIKILFSATSSVNYRKGFNFLAKAINKINDNKDFILYVVGDKPKKFNDIKIQKKFFGYINSDKKLKNIYNNCDVLIVPSIMESFGQIYVEAGSLGLLSIAFKSTAVEEIINHKKTGYLAEFKSVEDLTNGILWAKDQLIKKKASKKNIRKFINNNFSSEKIINNYISLYKKKLKSNYI